MNWAIQFCICSVSAAVNRPLPCIRGNDMRVLERCSVNCTHNASKVLHTFSWYVIAFNWAMKIWVKATELTSCQCPHIHNTMQRWYIAHDLFITNAKRASSQCPNNRHVQLCFLSEGKRLRLQDCANEKSNLPCNTNHAEFKAECDCKQKCIFFQINILMYFINLSIYLSICK